MSCFIEILKCIFCVEDDEDRAPKYEFGSRTRTPLTSQTNYGQNTTSSRVHNECYPSLTKSTFVLKRETIDENSFPIKLPGNGVVKSSTSSTVSGIRSKSIGVTSQFSLPSSVHSQQSPSATAKPILSSISQKPNESQQKPKSLHSSSSSDNNSRGIDSNRGTNTSKSPSISNREAIENNLVPIKLSGNEITKSTKSSAVCGINNKNSSFASQFSLPSVHSQKPPSATAKPILSSFPEKPIEIPQKLNNLRSSSFSGNVRLSKDENKGINKNSDPKQPYDVSSAAFTPLKSSPKLPPFSHSLKLPPSASKTEKHHSPLKADQSSSSTVFEKTHSPKPPPLSMKPTLSLAPSSSLTPQEKAKYIWVEKDALSTYVFPKDIKSLIEKDIVPGVLKMPLSKSSYKDYFHALLYAEDCYLEKWDGFEMKNVTLELHEAAIYTRRGKHKNLYVDGEKDEKTFVAFEIDKIHDRRPFLLSRDFVSLQPSNRKTKTFQGVIYRVVKSNLVLAEFGETFYSQHHPECKYDVKFSFNRVCLKRAHQAIATASCPLFRNLLFPSIAPNHEFPSTEIFAKYKYWIDAFAVRQILRLHGAPPYLVEGPLSVIEKKHLSRSGVVIVEAILRIFRANPSKKVLLCAPVNRTCDLLMRGLKKEMAESDMFRANAAFRELDGVPMDILPSCLYEREMECFSCPSLEELKKYKLILSTFMSSFRLYGEGIVAGHFSHIFLIDASSATEPEKMIPLANFANETTTVVVTGASRNHSGWIRSEIAREYGLMTSYFERLRKSGLYKKLDPKVITQLEDTKQDTKDLCSNLPPLVDLMSVYYD